MEIFSFYSKYHVTFIWNFLKNAPYQRDWREIRKLWKPMFRLLSDSSKRLESSKGAIILVFQLYSRKQQCNLVKAINFLFLLLNKNCWNKGFHIVPFKSDSYFPRKCFYLLQSGFFKDDEKCFFFHLKSSFRSKDI